MQINEIDQNPVLIKLHKHGVTGVNAKKLEAVVTSLLEGWTAEKAKIWIPNANFRQNFSRWSALDKISQTDRDVRVSGGGQYSSTPGHYTLEAIHFHDTLYQAVEQLKKTPANLTVKISDVRTVEHYRNEKDGAAVANLYSERLATSLRLTSPSGDSFDLLTTELQYDMSKFYKWAESTDFFTQIAALLGMDVWIKPEDRTNTYSREGAVAGHCAICGREQATKHNKMVRHGYQRPGYGYLVGMCFGAYKDAYEISPDACKQYIPELEGYIRTSQKRLADIESGKVVPTYQHRDTFSGTVTEIGPDHRRYSSMLDGELRREATNIKYATQDIERMKKQIANWKPGKLRTIGPLG